MSNDDRDSQSFERLVGKVKRIEHDTVDTRRPRRPSIPRQSERGAESVMRDLDRGDVDGEPLDSGNETDYHRPGLQHSVLRKLRRGHYAISDELDLHGLTAPEAKVRLAAFLDHMRGERLACVRIVHGKGFSSPGRNPVLKPKVCRWLRHHDGVLAFTAARHADGGSGALYVLLRRV